VDLATVPLLLILLGLVMYTVLAGADFGAGMWELSAAAGPRSERIREHVHRSMAPVWEANHVWLIFVLVVTWTAYPPVFASIASTPSVALLVAAVGIILRGASYALRSSGTKRPWVERLFALSSILTPFMLGAAVGGIASRRVPVGNAAGDEIGSWLNPTSVAIGVLAVVVCALLSAVYLCGDAARRVDPATEDAFRQRALVAGAIAAGVALAALAVLRSDAPRTYHGLTSGAGRPALAVAVVAAVVSLGLIWRRDYGRARVSAALSVATIVAGWVLAQQPDVLPGLTLKQAAAPHDTLVSVIAVVLAGAVLLLPALGLLFGMHLSGRFDREEPAAQASPGGRAGRVSLSAGLAGRAATALFVSGFALLNIADAAWAHAIGVALLAGFVAAGFVALVPPQVDAPGSRPTERRAPVIAGGDSPPPSRPGGHRSTSPPAA
jgi:cytochrome d ubiquinol oxidase subunit II